MTRVRLRSSDLGSWIDCGDVLLPAVADLMLEDLSRNHGGNEDVSHRRHKATRVSYADGRIVDTQASSDAILRALMQQDDAVSAELTVSGQPEDKV